MGYEVASLTLGPVLAIQGRRMRRTATRLPEPPGPRAGIAGTGPPLRLLLLGDSAAAGVGATSQADALSGRLVEALSPAWCVRWTLVARSGATTAATARHLARWSPEDAAPFDVAVVSLGANDVMGRCPRARWLSDLDEVVALLRDRFGVRHILLSGLPPMHRFSAFPQPLRWYLGLGARRFDHALARWTSRLEDCEHVPLALPESDAPLASDGMHPSPLAYALWAAELARRIRARWLPAADAAP